MSLSLRIELLWCIAPSTFSLSLIISCRIAIFSGYMATNENLPPNVIKQLAKELKNLNETPPEGIKVGVDADNFSIIHADIEGPDGTPYENGVFHMKLILSHDFPYSPPKGYFFTKIFHPNIANNGEICVNALKKDWNPTLGLRHVLMVIRCLLIEPFPESALNEQAGKMLLEDYEEYARLARLYTGIHAVKSKPKSKTGGGISESKTALNVDPSNTTLTAAAAATTTIVEQKNAVVGATLQHPSQLMAPCSNDGKVGLTTHQDHHPVAAKVVAEKKKIDARKKSLKRL